MAVIYDTNCHKTFVTAHPFKSGEKVKCPFCSTEQNVYIFSAGVYKGEGYI